jgi:anti-sigma B factor antagonist
MDAVTGTEKGILVSCASGDVHVRIVGRGTFQNGTALRRFALEMIKRGHEQFVIDLRRCQGMDSTFLGVLAGIGLSVRRENRKGSVRVIKAGATNLEQLETLGLDRLFEVNAPASDDPGHPLPTDAEFRELPDSDITRLVGHPDKQEIANLMLKAHGDLIEADRRNEEKFRDLTKRLREKVGQRDAAEKKRGGATGK